MTRDEAILSLWPIAKSLSRLHKDHAGWLTYEDLRQEAMIGAIHAVARHKGTNGASLGHYAGKVMRGAVLHAIRDHNHRRPGLAVRVDVVDHDAALALAELHMEPLWTPWECAVRDALLTALARLPERERICLFLHYWCDQDLTTVGAQWGLTKHGASRIHRAALARLGQIVDQRGEVQA